LSEPREFTGYGVVRVVQLLAMMEYA